jgi:threonine/homoserine/homoserine lactone efflux protein
MNEAIGEFLPLAIGVAISPGPIIAVVLLLATPHARTAGPAFLLGCLAGLAIAGTIILLLAGTVDASDSGEPATWVSLVKIALGALLAFVGVRTWRGRPRGDQVAEMPSWMSKIDSLRAPKAFGLGLLLSGVNPKNLLLTVAAAAAIAQTGISSGEQAAALAVFVALGMLGVATPVAIFFALGDRSRTLLDGMRSWMAANNAVIMAVLVLVIGAKLVGDGIAGL